MESRAQPLYGISPQGLYVINAAGVVWHQAVGLDRAQRVRESEPRASPAVAVVFADCTKRIEFLRQAQKLGFDSTALQSKRAEYHSVFRSF